MESWKTYAELAKEIISLNDRLSKNIIDQRSYNYKTLITIKNFDDVMYESEELQKLKVEQQIIEFNLKARKQEMFNIGRQGFRMIFEIDDTFYLFVWLSGRLVYAWLCIEDHFHNFADRIDQDVSEIEDEIQLIEQSFNEAKKYIEDTYYE